MVDTNINWSKELSKAITYCYEYGEQSLRSIARYIGLGYSTVKNHKAWMDGKSYGREWKGTRRSRHTELILSDFADACEDKYNPRRPVAPPKVTKNTWETVLTWKGKHGGSNRNQYTEEFKATVTFELDDKASHIEAQDVGIELLDKGLVDTGYPSSGFIERNWHDAIVGTKQVAGSYDNPEFVLEQTESGSKGVRLLSYAPQEQETMDPKEIWRRQRGV